MAQQRKPKPKIKLGVLFATTPEPKIEIKRRKHKNPPFRYFYWWGTHSHYSFKEIAILKFIYKLSYRFFYIYLCYHYYLEYKSKLRFKSTKDCLYYYRHHMLLTLFIMGYEFDNFFNIKVPIKFFSENFLSFLNTLYYFSPLIFCLLVWLYIYNESQKEYMDVIDPALAKYFKATLKTKNKYNDESMMEHESSEAIYHQIRRQQIKREQEEERKKEEEERKKNKQYVAPTVEPELPKKYDDIFELFKDEYNNYKYENFRTLTKQLYFTIKAIKKLVYDTYTKETINKKFESDDMIYINVLLIKKIFNRSFKENISEFIKQKNIVKSYYDEIMLMTKNELKEIFKKKSFGQYLKEYLKDISLELLNVIKNNLFRNYAYRKQIIKQNLKKKKQQQIKKKDYLK